MTSFCACELRSPAAFTEDGFRAFNQHYVKTLAEWGLFDGTTNPVARSNVCPEIDPPGAAVILCLLLHPTESTIGECRPSSSPAAPKRVAAAGSYPERIVRYRDLSPRA